MSLRVGRQANGFEGLRAVRVGWLSLLYDIYGGLLTPNQRRLFELYYHRDLSLAEIASDERVSRQAVHDALQRSERTLLEAEQRLGLAAWYTRQRRLLDEALAQARRAEAAARRLGQDEVVRELEALCGRLRQIAEAL